MVNVWEIIVFDKGVVLGFIYKSCHIIATLIIFGVFPGVYTMTDIGIFL